MCEDFPCCGHSLGDCPDSNGSYKCVQCGKRLPKNSPSSICDKCIKRMMKYMDDGRDDFDYSMNY